MWKSELLKFGCIHHIDKSKVGIYDICITRLDMHAETIPQYELEISWIKMIFEEKLLFRREFFQLIWCGVKVVRAGNGNFTVNYLSVYVDSPRKDDFQ